MRKIRQMTNKVFGGGKDRATEDVRLSNLGYQLTLAFYRREHETIETLAKQPGVPFTQEMLQVAVGLGDKDLVDLCLDRKVKPEDDTMKIAVDRGNAAIFTSLAKKSAPSPELLHYISTKGSKEIRAVAPK